MSSINVKFTYPPADFVAPGANPNSKILAAELVLLGLTVAVLRVDKIGSDMVVEFQPGSPTAGDKTLVDGAVAVHVGGVLTFSPNKITLEAESASDDSGNDITYLSLADSKLLGAGSWEITYYAEVRMTNNDPLGTNAARGRFVLNGVERGIQHNPFDQYMNMAGTFPLNVVDGTTLTMDLTYRRFGSGPNPVFMQRARLAYRLLAVASP